MTGTDPCTCGRSPEEHGRDPEHPGSTGCVENGCIAYEANSNALPKKERGSVPCQGWIRVMGFSAIGVRILAMQGKITIEEVEDRDGPKLFRSFVAMMRANKIELPKRSRLTPKRRRT